MSINKNIFFCTLLFTCVWFLPANGQKLNEAYMQARAAMQREQYAEAGQKILSIPASERTPAMYLTLGESYYMAGKYNEAARFFAMADSLKNTPDAELYAARAYAMMSQPAQATEWLQKYLAQRDKLSESEIELDPALEKLEHSKEWKTLWNKEWYNASERKIAEATVLAKRKKYTEALAIIDVEISNKTASAKFYALRAKVYEAMEQYDPAFESAQTATRLRTNNSVYFADAANLAVHVRKYDVALENINQAIRLDSYQLDFYLQRAAILRMSKQYDEARKDLNFYFTYLPSDTKALYQLGIAETEGGNPLAGIEYFTMLIDKDKTTPDYYIARANASIKANNYAMAGDDLAQALDLNPKLPEAWCKKGLVLQQQNQLDDACFYWKKAMELGNSEAAGYIYKYCTK